MWETGMTEVTSDGLEASFEAVETAGLPPLRPVLAGGRPLGSAAFEGFLRAGGGALEMKAMSGVSEAAGGYAVPDELDARIDATLKAVSPIRGIAQVVKVGSSGYRKLVTSGGFESGWAAETAARDETDTPVFNEIAPPMGDLYANPAASQAMLDDAAFDVEGWLAGEVAREFAAAEGAAFVGGDGVNKPRGFLSAATSAVGDGARAFGTLQHLASGAAGGFAANPEEKLIDLVQSLRTPYRQGAVWVMNSATLARIRKFKTSDGAFLWQPSLSAGQPATLLGYAVVEAEDMPDIAANSLSIAFGNFKAGYLIAERGETQVLRDPYSNKPFVHFYATKRVGGMVSNSEAIKLLKFAAA
jgi:HK97 family phage major capsid protein